MAETGCLKDGHFQNLEADNHDANVFTGSQAAFVNKYGRGLSATTNPPKSITTTHCNAGRAAADAADHTHTDADALTWEMTANAVTETLFDGGSAGLISLPPAIQGTCCLLRLAATGAGVNALTIQTYHPTDVYAKQAIGIPNATTATSEVTLGSDAEPEANEIVWTTVAGNEQMSTGSEFWFFCPKDKIWVVDTRAVANGTGAAGTLVAEKTT
jgi:hypothetical protein